MKKSCLKEDGTLETTTLTPEVTYTTLGMPIYDSYPVYYNYKTKKSYTNFSATIDGVSKNALIDSDGNFVLEFAPERYVSIATMTDDFFAVQEIGDPTQEPGPYNFISTIRNFDNDVLYTLDIEKVREKFSIDDSIDVSGYYIGTLGTTHYFVVYSSDEKNYIYNSNDSGFETDIDINNAEFVFGENDAFIILFSNSSDDIKIFDLNGNLKLDGVSDVGSLDEYGVNYLMGAFGKKINMFVILRNNAIELYDYGINKLYTFDESIQFVEDIVALSYPKTNGDLQNGNYLFLLDSLIDPPYLLMTIESADKIAIDGSVVDQDGNPLKNKNVELHSEVMTTITNGNGYFHFDNVVEGDHTLTVKNEDGTTLASTNVTFVPGDTTSITDNIITYKNSIDELTIRIKVDGDSLIITSVEEGLKNPETGDNLFLYITLVTVSIVGLAVTNKFRKNSVIKSM